MTYGLLTALLSACSSASAPAAPLPTPPDVVPAAAPGPTRAQLLSAGDARRLPGLLSRAVIAPDADVRAEALLAVARLHDLEAAPLLIRALRDPDPRARDHASLGLGAYETRAPDGVAEALTNALAVESDLEVRAHMLEDLGRLAVPETLSLLPSELASDQPRQREAACRAAGAHALAGRALPEEILTRLAARVADENSAAVRLACAYALSRATPPTDTSLSERLTTQLSSALRDPDPDVRVFVVRALGRLTTTPLDVLIDASRDADWRVAVHALRALSERRDVPSQTRRMLLERALGSATGESGTLRAGGPMHVLLAAFQVAGADARADQVHQLATRVHDTLGRVPDGQAADRDRGLAHCAAAELVDRGRGWPSRVQRCGLEQISDTEREVQAAGILADVEGAEAQRMVFVRRLAQSEVPRVREAALTAAGRIDHPDSLALLIQHLSRESDPGVLTTALDALRGRLARQAGARMDAALSGGDVEDVAPDPALVAGLRRAGSTLRELDDLEGLVTFAGALEDAGLPGLASELQPLAHHAVLAVRLAAEDALEALGEAVTAGARGRVADPIETSQIGAGSSRVRLVTDRGELVIELDADVAPTTVARFTSLVSAGFYTGLSFHRVVSAFVVQGGDPRGDGYGGPGWAQRCEDSRTRYQRGTVGMALAGRDTGGSQFFIAHGAQPHLEGRYTVFGRVVEGLEVLDQLQAGDSIRSITLEDE